jgi:hypothetical protein
LPGQHPCRFATGGNYGLSAARWLLFALFVLIDLMPVLIKVMLNLGPKSIYDQMLDAEEQNQLRVAAHQRALRLRTQMMKAEAEQAAEQAVLTAWEAGLPEVTQEVIAARARVETRRLKAWEDDQTRRLAEQPETAPSAPFSPGIPGGGKVPRSSAEPGQAGAQ